MLKFLLIDEESLTRYCEGEYPTISDLKRRMVKCARKLDYSTTDSHYHLKTYVTFENIETISDILTVGMSRISKLHLKTDGERLYVKEEMQNSYQDILPYIPPLLLQASIIYTEFPLQEDITFYYEKFILPNNRFTAILSPKISVIESIVEKKRGLLDLHIHLNGSLETDAVWQDYLASPKDAYNSIKTAFEREKVKEQFEQESVMLKPEKYLYLLETAQGIRRYLYDYLYPQDGNNPKKLSKIEILNQITQEQKKRTLDYQHPFLAIIKEEDPYQHLMSVECLMYVMVLNEIEKKGNEALAGLFHFYLLILGLTNRLLVQQLHQYGFEQFQKHTLNKMREKSEAVFSRRFFQLHGNDLRYLRFMEGRFAPKDKESSLVKMIDNIYRGWMTLQEVANSEIHKIPMPVTKPELKLIAHFIKEADIDPDCYIRHKRLRLQLASRAKALSKLISMHRNYQEKIVGLDAAASEFDTPPEVFAPAFRAIKRELIKKRTYHAGEDFHHLISGLRAIFEAVEFCQLSKGDRIGHAVAAGISAKKWSNVVGVQMLIPKGEYLDNLIFCRYMIQSSNIETLLPKLIDLETEAEKIICEIYGEGYSITEYQSSWMMRELCPRHAFPETEQEARNIKSFNQDEMDYINDKKIIKGQNDFLLFKKYHELYYRKIGEMIININTEDIINRKAMKILQLNMLRIIADKGIVIETLPTSNVRIGIHRDFSTYHLQNWIKWEESGKTIPKIIVGSDDTGIFATNIYNEYANIYCLFGKIKGWTDEKRYLLIETLNNNSEDSKFD